MALYKMICLMFLATPPYFISEAMGSGNAPRDDIVQSSTFNEHGVRLALDNDPTTCAKTGFDVGPWWKVDLGEVKEVTGLTITGRVDVFQVRVGNDTEGYRGRRGFDHNPLCMFHIGIDSTEPVSINCRRARVGRYLSIHVVDPAKHSQISLCEVHVHSI